MNDLVFRDITGDLWEKIVERNERPVFVMFYSPSCSHCTRIMPYVEEIAKEFTDRVTFVRLNLLDYEYIGSRYGVMATPTFIFFCGGRPVQTRVGAMFPAMIKKMAEEMAGHGEECRLSSTDWKYEITGYG